MVTAKPDIEKEDMNAADECNDALRSPRPPLLRLSWACCQTKSDGSMHMLSEKVWRTSSSNNRWRCASGNMDQPTETTALV